MKILMLWGQRKCRYSGEYAPELLDAIDEYSHEDNPQYLIESVEENALSGAFSHLQIIETTVNLKEIERILTQNNSIKIGDLFVAKL